MADAVAAGTASWTAIAARLTDIAGTVARDAEEATARVRTLTGQAHEIAALAATLEQAAVAMEDEVRCQAEALAHTRRSLSENRPMIDALAISAKSVAAISALIAGIAQQSWLLGLNARIEASRDGQDGHGFIAVAREMEGLAVRTKQSTGDIAARAEVIARDVEAAREIVTAHGALVVSQDELLAATLDRAAHQHEAVATLARITAGSAATIDQAAAAMGRVGASAAALRVMARQVGRLAAEEAPPAG